MPDLRLAPTARETLLQLMAEWMLTTGHGSREAADAILGQHRAEVSAELEGLREQLAVLRDLVGSLVDPDPCDLDHHGYCQAHGWTYTEPACPMARAAELGLIVDDDEETDRDRG